MNLSPADIAQNKVDIEAVYQRIFAQQMQSLPFVSPHIEIEMVSLQPYQLKSSAHIQSVQLDYQRISIEPCLIGLTQSQVMQRIGQLISLCPVSHQVASLASFSVAQATTCPEISVEQQTQLKQEWINTYAMQWMQVAQRLNLANVIITAWFNAVGFFLDFNCTKRHQTNFFLYLGLSFPLSCGIITVLSKRANLKVSVRRIMAITSAFQADDAGSIPAARSNRFFNTIPM